MGCLLLAVAKKPVASKAACKWLKLAILAAFFMRRNRHLQNGVYPTSLRMGLNQLFYVPFVAPVTRERVQMAGIEVSVTLVSVQNTSKHWTFFFFFFNFTIFQLSNATIVYFCCLSYMTEFTDH